MASYEHSDALPGRLLVCGLAVVLLVLLSAGLCGWLHQAWRPPAGPLSSPIPLEVKPLVSKDPPELHQPAWLDRSAGLVQIPILEAMNVLASAHPASAASPQPVGPASPPVRAAPGSSHPAVNGPDR